MNGEIATNAQDEQHRRIKECAGLIVKHETIHYEDLIKILDNAGYSFDEITEALFLDLDKRVD